MNAAEKETEVLNSIVPKLKAEGYDVHVHPPRSLLPPFMQSYMPDAIALGEPKNLAIEVVIEGPSSESRLSDLQHRFRDIKNWDLRVYYAKPIDDRSDPEVVSLATINDSLGTISKLIKIREWRAALLMSWATFEAIGRAMFPEKFIRPQTPRKLIEVLASDGYLLPSEADLLRDLADQRNRLIHGKIDVSIEDEDLQKFEAVLSALAKRIKRE